MSSLPITGLTGWTDFDAKAPRLRVGAAALSRRLADRPGRLCQSGWPTAPSLRSRVQRQGAEDRLAQLPSGPPDTPWRHAERGGLPRPALLRGLCQQLALPLLGELLGHVRVKVHLTHLLQVT